MNNENVAVHGISYCMWCIDANQLIKISRSERKTVQSEIARISSRRWVFLLFARCDLFVSVFGQSQLIRLFWPIDERRESTHLTKTTASCWGNDDECATLNWVESPENTETTKWTTRKFNSEKITLETIVEQSAQEQAERHRHGDDFQLFSFSSSTIVRVPLAHCFSFHFTFLFRSNGEKRFLISSCGSSAVARASDVIVNCCRWFDCVIFAKNRWQMKRKLPKSTDFMVASRSRRPNDSIKVWTVKLINSTQNPVRN